MSPVLPTPVSPMKTMFSALGMKASCASVRIWRSLTPDLEGEGFQGPGFGQLRALEPSGKRGLLTGLPLGAQQLGDECCDRCAVTLGGGEILVEVSGDRFELEVDQQLLK